MCSAAWALAACVIGTACALTACSTHSAAASMQAGQPACHYGMLPGGWIRATSRAVVDGVGEGLQEAFPVWQPYSAACQLKPLLTPFLQVRSCGVHACNRPMLLTRYLQEEFFLTLCSLI